MIPKPHNSSSNPGADDGSMEYRIYKVFEDIKQASADSIFKEFDKRGWQYPKSNTVNSTLARLTNTGMLRQVGKDADGNTVWERTALKTPLEDNRLNSKDALKELRKIQSTLGTLATMIRRGDKITPDADLFDTYSKSLQAVVAASEGYTDRTDDPEYKRRIANGW